MDNHNADLIYDFDDLNGLSLLPEQASDFVVQQVNDDEFSYNAVDDFGRNQTQKSAVGNLQVFISVNIKNDYFQYVFHRFKLTD